MKTYQHMKLGSTNSVQIITERLSSCLDKLEKTMSSLGALTPSSEESDHKLHLFELCKMMHDKGYMLASFVPPDSNILEDFKVRSGELSSDPSGKPTHSIYFSHLEDIKLEDEASRQKKLVPGWFNWIHDHEDGDTGKIKEYNYRDILFAKIDQIKIKEISDIRMIDYSDQSKIKLKIQVKALQVPDYANLPAMYDGVHVETVTSRYHPIWGCETTAIWNTRCITEMKCFRGLGKWEYASEPLIDVRNVQLFKLCKEMRTQGFDFVAFIPTEMSKAKPDLVHDFMITSPALTSKSDGRPTNSVYFTRLQPIGTSSTICPAWYDWITDPSSGRGDEIQDFSKFNIVFANINLFKIHGKEDGEIPMTVIFTDDNHDIDSAATNQRNSSRVSAHRVIHVVDYKRIGLKQQAATGNHTKTYDGIEVDPTDPQFNGKAWGVDTVAVWNFGCINEMKYFRNTGEWSYAKMPLFYGDPSD